MNRAIAFFDFDGTVTTRDTFLEFIKFTHGRLRFVTGFLLNIHYLVAFKAGIIPNQSAKEKILRYFYEGSPEGRFNEQCERFARRVLPRLIRPKAMEEISRLREKGCVVVVVSASAENWLVDWARNTGVELIASRLEVKEGRITGRIIGKNCRGKEKVRRILEKYRVSDYTDVYAYGDSKGDAEMLELARFAYYKPFRR